MISCVYIDAHLIRNILITPPIKVIWHQSWLGLSLVNCKLSRKGLFEERICYILTLQEHCCVMMSRRFCCVFKCTCDTCPGVSPRDSWLERVGEKVAPDSRSGMRGITGHHWSHQATGEMDSNSGPGARRGADHHWPRSVTDKGTRDLQVNSYYRMIYNSN